VAALRLGRDLGPCTDAAPEQAAVGQLAGVREGCLGRRSGRTVKRRLGDDSIQTSGGSASYQCQIIETFLTARAKE
jgi:hypothetical protein